MHFCKKQNRELICESLPQLMLNLANMYVLNVWNDPISVTSAIFSATVIAYNVIKIVYFVGYKDKDLKQFVL